MQLMVLTVLTVTVRIGQPSHFLLTFFIVAFSIDLAVMAPKSAPKSASKGARLVAGDRHWHATMLIGSLQ